MLFEPSLYKILYLIVNVWLGYFCTRNSIEIIMCIFLYYTLIVYFFKETNQYHSYNKTKQISLPENYSFDIKPLSYC